MDTLRVRQWLTTALEGDSSPMVVASIHASRTDTPLAGDFSRLAYQNHNAYCARWGYRYLALSETMLGRRRCLGNGVACLTPHAKMDLRLLKVPFLRELLSQPAAKLVFWCDYDSVFTNLEVPLHTLAPAKDLGFAGATCGLLNAGHLFVRPTSWTMQLLSVVEQTQGKNRAEKCPGQEGLTDNAAFRFHLGRGNCSIGLLDASSAAGCEQSMASLDPEMQAHVACIPQRAINSHPPWTHDRSGYCNWQPGDVILHVPGARHVNVTHILAAGLSGELSVAWMQQQGYSTNSEVHPGCGTCAQLGVHPSTVGSAMQHALRTSGARYVQKWDSYLPSYERYLGKYVGRQPLFLELGVQSVAAMSHRAACLCCGGSQSMFLKYFGDGALAIGADIEPEVRRFDDERRRNLVGDIGDPRFLRRLCAAVAPRKYDVIIDDASHINWHQTLAFKVLWPCLSSSGVYIVEDITSSYDPGPPFLGGVGARSDSFVEFAKAKSDELNAYWSCARTTPEHCDAGHGALVTATEFTRSIGGIHWHDGLVVFEKVAAHRPAAPVEAGVDVVPKRHVSQTGVTREESMKLLSHDTLRTCTGRSPRQGHPEQGATSGARDPRVSKQCNASWPAQPSAAMHAKLVEFGSGLPGSTHRLHLRHLRDFAAVYRERPVVNNACGVKINHAYALYASVRELQPSVVVESGVNTGATTYFIRAAAPSARIIAIDPLDQPLCLNQTRWVDPHTTYLVGAKFVDFGSVPWDQLSPALPPGWAANALAFFDDHTPHFDRLAQLQKVGILSALFEDNYLPGMGDLKRRSDSTNAAPDADGTIQGNSAAGFKPRPELGLGLKQLFRRDDADGQHACNVIKSYTELPIISDHALYHWGFSRPWRPAFDPGEWQRPIWQPKKCESDHEQFQMFRRDARMPMNSDEWFDYNFFCFVRLDSLAE